MRSGSCLSRICSEEYFNGEPGGWVDKGKTQLRIAKPSIKIGDMSLGEMLVNWKDGAPQSMTVMMYNKGG